VCGVIRLFYPLSGSVTWWLRIRMVPAMKVITTPIAKYPGIPRYVAAIAADIIMAIPAYVAGAPILSAMNSRPTIAVIGHRKQSKNSIITGLWTFDVLCDDIGAFRLLGEILSEN
jgi:hypothetical protein